MADNDPWARFRTTQPSASAPAAPAASPRVTTIVPGNVPQGRASPSEAAATAYAETAARERAQEEARARDEAARRSPERQRLTLFRNQALLDTIRRARENTSNWTAGFGSYLASLPGTEARDLAGDIGTIRANIGFDRLQEMREESPTGGALGQVAVQELEALQNSISSLDTGLDPDDLRRNLQNVELHYVNLRRINLGQQPYENWSQYSRAQQRLRRQRTGTTAPQRAAPQGNTGGFTVRRRD